MGHWLGLKHIWGDDNGTCTGSDDISDTPNQGNSYVQLCPSGNQASCSSNDMYMNYMDYTDDACMNIVTNGQKIAMRATLNTGGYREDFGYLLPAFSGPSLVCSSGASLSLNNLPSGVNIIWAQSTNITRNSSQGANPCTFSANGTGSGWIEAAITNPNGCGNITTIREAVWVGKPNNDNIVFGVLNTLPDNQVPTYQNKAIGVASNSDASSQGVTGYHWQFFSWQPYITGYQDYFGYDDGIANIYLTSSSSSQQIVQVSAINSCGYEWEGGAAKIFYANSGYYMVVYPNPSVSEIFIVKNTGNSMDGEPFGSLSNSPSATMDGSIDIEIYDFNKSTILSKHFSKSEIAPVVDVSKLKKGNYILRIIGNEVEESHHIVVE